MTSKRTTCKGCDEYDKWDGPEECRFSGEHFDFDNPSAPDTPGKNCPVNLHTEIAQLITTIEEMQREAR